MMYECPDHPDIVAIERTGYPTWMKEDEIICERCGDDISGDVYEDECHETLCEYCLLKLHLKEEW